MGIPLLGSHDGCVCWGSIGGGVTFKWGRRGASWGDVEGRADCYQTDTKKASATSICFEVSGGTVQYSDCNLLYYNGMGGECEGECEHWQSSSCVCVCV